MRIYPVDNPHWDQHQEVHFFTDEATGLRAYIAIHSAGPLGIAGGGCRMMRYASDVDALSDVLRLSQAMSAKMILAGVNAGGAKCVINGDPAQQKTPALLASLAQAIDTLEGRFVAGADVNTTVEDLRVLAQHTPYVERAGPGEDVGSDMTARGVLAAMEAAVEERLQRFDLRGVRVAIQGTGKVGAKLARLLHQRGAQLTLADVNEVVLQPVARELQAQAVPASEILSAEVDVLSPCALSDVLTPRSVRALRCKVVVGSANNQLSEPQVAGLLAQRNILNVPDYVANMGGVLAGAHPRHCASEEGQVELASQVREVTQHILRRAAERAITPQRAAEEITAERAAQLQADHRRLSRAAARTVVGQLWKRPWFARSVLNARALAASAGVQRYR